MVRAFLEALFGEIPDDRWWLVWSKQERVGEGGKPVKRSKSKWFKGPQGIDPAVPYIEAEAAEWDVYVQVSLSERDLGIGSRCSNADSAGIVGMWADIDIAHNGASKKYPPTEQDALELVRSMGADPSIVIHSGHGLHVWWLFREPWLIGSDHERVDVAHFARRWGRSLEERARERGWQIDTVSDLARLLRVPGTLNHKETPPLPVRILSSDPVRYDPSDLEAFFTESSFAEPDVAERITADPVRFTLKPLPVPPSEKFEALVANCDRFRRLIEHTEPLPDGSTTDLSRYDARIAVLLLKAGWTDQEIVDTILWHRHKWGNHKNDNRPDYFIRTINGARGWISDESSVHPSCSPSDASSVLQVVQSSGGTEDERREQAIASLRSLLGIPITRIVKTTSDPPVYEVFTTSGSVTLERDQFTRQETLRSALYGVCNKFFPRFLDTKKHPGRWEDVMDLIGLALEEEGAPSVETREGWIESVIREYLKAHPWVDLSTLPPEERKAAEAEALRVGRPYCDGENVYVAGPHVEAWCARTGRRKYRDIVGCIQRYLCDRGKVHKSYSRVVDGQVKRTSRDLYPLAGGPDYWKP